MESATERGTYVITASFYDESEAAVTPNSVTWTLTDGYGKVVNSRSAVAATPSTSVDIVLSGDDLDLDDGEQRILRVDADYDSTYGSGLPLISSVSFLVEAV